MEGAKQWVRVVVVRLVNGWEAKDKGQKGKEAHTIVVLDTRSEVLLLLLPLRLRSLEKRRGRMKWKILCFSSLDI